MNPQNAKQEQEGAHTPLPKSVRLVRTHPNKETRDGLMELVTHDHSDFGHEEAMFFAAPEGSDRARLAYALRDRYNSHASDQRKIAELREALKPFASLLESDGIDKDDPDDAPFITGASPVHAVMGVRKTFVTVGDIRRAAALQSSQ